MKIVQVLIAVVSFLLSNWAKLLGGLISIAKAILDFVLLLPFTKLSDFVKKIVAWLEKFNAK